MPQPRLHRTQSFTKSQTWEYPISIRFGYCSYSFWIRAICFYSTLVKEEICWIQSELYWFNQTVPTLIGSAQLASPPHLKRLWRHIWLWCHNSLFVLANNFVEKIFARFPTLSGSRRSVVSAALFFAINRKPFVMSTFLFGRKVLSYNLLVTLIY